MINTEYNKVEAPALQQLQQHGWHYIHGAKLTPDTGERTAMRDVVLINRLNNAIKRLNPWISEENLRKISREITHPVKSGLIEYNQHLWEILFGEGLSVEQDIGSGRRGQTVTIIDTEYPDNNEFLCTNQFKVAGVSENIIPDIVCFVNGIPLAVIECKSPFISDPISEGINQLRRYANLRRPHDEEGAERLFWYNQLMVSTCRDNAKFGTISASAQHYGYWKDAYPLSDEALYDQLNSTQRNNFTPTENSAEFSENIIGDAGASAVPDYLAEDVDDQINPMQRMLGGMFSRANFIDLMQNFIIFELDEGKIIKKAARYQQYRAVNKVIEQLKTGKDRREKSGVVWHTQGSGKSLTMVMLAIKMRRDPELSKYKLVFITDRTQLDRQLSKTFRNAQGETVLNATSVAKLKSLLKRDSSDLVTAMVQKFADWQAEARGDSEFENINTSERIIVLADEAHRTQFGTLAMTINAALPNAPKIGFTGTPLLTSLKMDEAFGGYIDEYRINEAVEDGATVRLLYEGREALTQVAGDSLDSLFEEYFADYSDEEKREIRKKYGADRAVREAPARVRRICIDLLEHYRTTVQPDGYKAMIVVGSRHAATVYKQMLDELDAPPSEVIISGSQNDLPYISQYTDATHRKKVIEDFKYPLDENPVAFLIVKDMLLTGFDAPIAQVMYIDRSLKEHSLMQAIARVNRTYKQKDCGYVVDYYGLADNLAEALDMFSSDEVEGTYHTLKDELPKLKAAHTVAMSFFKKVIDKGSTDVDDWVMLLKDEEVRSQFDLAFKRFAKQMNIVLPNTQARPFLTDLRQLGKVQNGARNKFHDKGMDLREAGEKVRQLVDEHILSTGVDPRIPPVDLLAANFKEQVMKSKSAESQAAEVESALKDHINVNLDEDPEFYKSLSLRLREIIEKTAGRWDQQLELLLEMVDGIETARTEAAAEHGLTEIEFAFYNILEKEVLDGQDVAVVNAEQLDAIKDTTRSLVDMFEENAAIVDLFSKPDQIKTMKKAIKRTVMEQEFGNKKLVKTLQDRFIELARTKFK